MTEANAKLKKLGSIIIFCIGCIFIAFGGEVLAEIFPFLERVLTSLGILDSVKQSGLLVGFIMATSVFTEPYFHANRPNAKFLKRMEYLCIAILVTGLFLV